MSDEQSTKLAADASSEAPNATPMHSTNLDTAVGDDGKITLHIRPVKKKPFTISLHPTATLSDVRDLVATHLGGGHVRLLHSGQQLTRGQLSDAGLRNNDSLTVLHSTAKSVDTVRSLREDVLLRGLQSTRNAPYTGAPRRSARRPSLFLELRTLPHLPDQAGAQAILEELATHPGFYAAMKRRGWSVGMLAEMYPDGRVGVDPVCVLGYNVNRGQEIRLRLRTDDLAGFRPLHRIRQVLAHELAHNEHSDHDDAFKELMLTVEREAEEGDWRFSTGRVIGSGTAIIDTTPGSRTMAARAALPPPPRRAASARASRLVREAESARRARTETSAVTPDAARDAEMENMHYDPAAAIEPSGGDGDAPKEDGAGAQGAPTAAPPPAPTLAQRRATPEVDALEAMGISRRLAQVALRETGGNDVARASEWVFAAIESSSREKSTDERVERLRSMVRALEGETGSSEQYVETLDTLHLYISNAMGAAQRRSINGGNAQFRRRVGRFEAAVGVLSASGFREQGGTWRAGVDAGALWIGKSVVQERLIQELYK